MALLTQTASDYYGGSDLGNYQFITVKDVINNFMVAYVGEGKIINKVKRTDVLFHASRAVQEFNFDILPSTKAIEIDLGPALTFQLPQDYVNYVNVSYTDSEGIQRIIYPTRDTSAPTAPLQNADFDILFDSAGAISRRRVSQPLLLGLRATLLLLKTTKYKIYLIQIYLIYTDTGKDTVFHRRTHIAMGSFT